MTTSHTNQIQGSSPDLKTELARQLEELAPEAIADGKVDVAKLRELLADDAGDENERFGLFWPGKRRAMRAAQEPTTATLKPMKDQSKDWDTTKNVFIEGDNLEVLKVLQKHYHNKIKMIYIDPPYNTGKDFIYPDNYKEGLASYLEFTSQLDGDGKKLRSNSETEGRYHSNWLNMMYPRLKLARNLLTDDGVIFISIDDHEQENLHKVCNEIFGEANFVAHLAVINNWKGRSDDTYIATCHEHCLVYARRLGPHLQFNGNALSDEELEGYDKKDDVGYYRELPLRKTGKGWRAEDRPNMAYSVYLDESSGVLSLEPLQGAIKIEPVTKGEPGRWRWGQETFAVRLRSGDVVALQKSGRWDLFEKNRPSLGDISRTTKKKSLWYKPEYDTGSANTALTKLMGGEYFDNPKSPVFLRDLIHTVTGDQDIVLDFFSGSGTTAHAVIELNVDDGQSRHFIQVQLPEPTPVDGPARAAGFRTLSEIGRKRISLAGDKIASELDGRLTVRSEPIDLGYRTYALADTNFSKWLASSKDDPEAMSQQLLELRESANDDATPEALLTELLLKQGYSLTEPIEHVDVGGLETWRVADGDVVAFLDERTKPSLDQLSALAESGARKLIVLEDAFQGDDELKTNLVQLCKTHGVELWTA